MSGRVGSPRLLHTMLRVRDLGRALDFYEGKLGMRGIRRRDFSEGRFTLAFLGYVDEGSGTVLELTHNWNGRDYQLGTAYGHIAIVVPDAVAALEGAGVSITRRAGPLAGDPSEVIAFVEDPDGYRIELIERQAPPAAGHPDEADLSLSNYLRSRPRPRAAVAGWRSADSTRPPGIGYAVWFTRLRAPPVDLSEGRDETSGRHTNASNKVGTHAPGLGAVIAELVQIRSSQSAPSRRAKGRL